MIDRLIAALKAEFTGDVQFHVNVPANLTAPSIVVAPGDPFIEPSTHGLVNERWEVLVVYNTTAPDRNVTQMRKNSLRIRRAVSTTGGLWSLTSGPHKAADETSTIAILRNQVSFRYNPSDLLEGDS